MTTPLSSMLLVLVASFVGSFGAVFLKSGANRLRFDFRSLLTNYQLALGIGLFLLSSYFFVLGMRQGELSVLYPLVSLGYVWTMAWSRLFFGERLTREKCGGLLLILIGIAFIGLGAAS
ncbi:MAG: EamA family transporter [Bryobacteraceae bacterium]